MSGPRIPRTPGERARASAAWAFASLALYVALVIAAWGIGSYLLDRDVIPGGHSPLVGPAALIASSIATWAAAFLVVRRSFLESRMQAAGAVVGGVAAGAVHALGLLVAVTVSDAAPSARSPFGVMLEHATGPFGLTVPIASVAVLLGASGMAAATARGSGRARP